MLFARQPCRGKKAPGGEQRREPVACLMLGEGAKSELVQSFAQRVVNSNAPRSVRAPQGFTSLWFSE